MSRKPTRKSVRLDTLIKNRDEFKKPLEELDKDLAASIEKDMIPLREEFVVRVLYPYDALGGDELSIQPGEVIRVTHDSVEEKGEWFYGKNLSNENFGIFPMSNCTREMDATKDGSVGSGGGGGKSNTKLGEKVDSMQAGLNDLESKVSEMGRSLADLEGRMASGSGGGGGVSGNKALEDRIKIIENKYDEFEDKLANIESSRGGCCW